MIPELTIVRTLGAAIPFEDGELLSVAFVQSDCGRLLAHGARASLPADTSQYAIPQAVAVSVLMAAGPYAANDTLILSFVDPTLARITSIAGSARTSESADDATVSERAATNSSKLPIERGIAVQTQWSRDRAERFAALVERLLAADRLGKHRHALAARLLLPDDLIAGEDAAAGGARAHLTDIKAAAVVALGEPLLASLMPDFTPSAAWLATIETPSLASALTAFEATLPALVAAIDVRPASDTVAVSSVLARSDFEAIPAANIDARLALLIPWRTAHAHLSERLGAYRRTLVENFAHVARHPAASRLKQRSQTHDPLDEQLWSLVGALQEAFGDQNAAA